MPNAAHPLNRFTRHRRPLATLVAILLAAFTVAALPACASKDDPPDPEAAGEAVQDAGVIPHGLVPRPAKPGDPTGLEAILATEPQPKDGWVSAPWALAATPDKSSKQIQIIYVAGDMACYGAIGFTLDESKSKVTIGSYLERSGPQTVCPGEPAAWKWGTIELANELGDRELVHAGVANMFKDYTWDRHTTPPEVPASTDPESEEEEPAQ
jgi:hypothetical protein